MSQFKIQEYTDTPEARQELVAFLERTGPLAMASAGKNVCIIGRMRTPSQTCIPTADASSGMAIKSSPSVEPFRQPMPGKDSLSRPSSPAPCG